MRGFPGWQPRSKRNQGEFCLFTQHPILYKDVTSKPLQDSIDKLQGILQAEGFLANASGKFDDNTVTAVRAFQTKKDLHIDGVVGPLTWACLLYPTLSRRDRNPSETVKQRITELQELLEKETLLKKKPDGCFDKETERAVKLFQRTYGLRADGIVGAWTWTILYGVRQKIHQAPQGIRYLPLNEHLLPWEQVLMIVCILAGIFYDRNQILMLFCVLAGVYYSPLGKQQSSFPVAFTTAYALTCLSPLLFNLLHLDVKALSNLAILQYAPYALTGIFWSPILDFLKNRINK
jgi:peptidoglycan hydrolase-like protein with peptidoglycan-binding domain